MRPPDFENEGVQLYRGDCLEIMRGMPDKSVDAVITDPPFFEIANHVWDRQWKSRNEWAGWCKEWANECYRVLGDSGSFLSFGDDKNIAYMQVALDGIGWQLINNIVWSKTNYTGLKADPEALRSFPVQAEERLLFYGKDALFDGTQSPMAGYLRSEINRSGISRTELQKLFPSKNGNMTGAISNWELGLNFPLQEQYETIRDFLNGNNGNAYLRRDYEELRRDYEELRRPFSNKQFTDVWSGAAISGGEKQHPTQKPGWIIKRILYTCTREGDTILDPFMGSGTTGVACVQTGRNFIGCEIDPTYFAIAEKRIADAQKQIRMPI